MDALDVVLERQIKAAKVGIIELATRTPDRWWTAFELKKRARNGWPASIVGLAFYELLDENQLEQAADRRVRIRPT